MHGNGILLPQQQQVAMAPIAMLNDMQLVALVAAQTPGPPEDAVKRAEDIVFHTVMRSEAFAQRVQAAMRARAAVQK